MKVTLQQAREEALRGSLHHWPRTKRRDDAVYPRDPLFFLPCPTPSTPPPREEPITVPQMGVTGVQSAPFLLLQPHTEVTTLCTHIVQQDFIVTSITDFSSYYRRLAKIITRG